MVYAGSLMKTPSQIAQHFDYILVGPVAHYCLGSAVLLSVLAFGVPPVHNRYWHQWE